MDVDVAGFVVMALSGAAEVIAKDGEAHFAELRVGVSGLRTRFVFAEERPGYFAAE